MVESTQQIAAGIHYGGFEEGDFVNVADKTYRICAPSESNKAPSSVILWTKSTKDDKKPEWSKVVCIFIISTICITLIFSQIGGFVYNLEKLHEMFSPNSIDVQDDAEATRISLM